MRLAAIVLAAAPTAAAAGELAITVRGFETLSGSLHYAVYDRPAAFPKPDGRIARGEVPVKGKAVRVVIPGLRPGAYAVAVFHDENGNGEFDQGLFGIPLEQYGFSNDARGFFGPPAFESARIDVGSGTRSITITVSY